MKTTLYLAALFLFSCTSTAIIPHPTPTTPLRACAITCRYPGIVIFQKQHLCSANTSRYFIDVWIIGEYHDTWIGCDGPPAADGICKQPTDYLKADVEFGSCDQVIRQIVDQRQPNERGQYPGEDNRGNPNPQP